MANTNYSPEKPSTLAQINKQKAAETKVVPTITLTEAELRELVIMREAEKQLLAKKNCGPFALYRSQQAESDQN